MKTLSRLIKTTFQRISRNPYHSVGAVFVMFLTFFVGGVFVLLSVGSNVVLNYFESRPQIDAFLKDEATQEEIDTLEKKLNDTGLVSKVKFISKDDALEIYKERNKDDPLLLEFVSSDILPASFQISSKKIDDLDQIADIVASEGIVENVVYQRDLVQTLSSWTKTIRNTGVVVVIFLLVTSLLITLIVISLNISLHREEIETMRLVGATEFYVRIPFILEGIFYGLMAAVLATLSIWLLLFWITPFLEEFLTNIPVLPLEPSSYLYLFLAEAITGVIIGTFGSYIATRKYLKV